VHAVCAEVYNPSASWLLPASPVTKLLQAQHKVSIELAESAQMTHRPFLAT